MTLRRALQVSLAAIALLAVAIAVFDNASRKAMRTRVAVNHPLLFTVPSGAEMNQVATRLESAGLVSCRG